VAGGLSNALRKMFDLSKWKAVEGIAGVWEGGNPCLMASSEIGERQSTVASFSNGSEWNGQTGNCLFLPRAAKTPNPRIRNGSRLVLGLRLDLIGIGNLKTSWMIAASLLGGARDLIFSVAKSFGVACGRIPFATWGFGRRVAANRGIGDEWWESWNLSSQREDNQ